MKTDRDVLGWLAMAAAITIAAHGEWSLAVAVGFSPYVAAALPVAIDAYAIRAMQAGREVAPAVLLMIATNSAAHLVHADQLPVSPGLVVGVSAIAPVVLWRVHALRRHAAQTPPAARRDTPSAEGVPPASPPVVERVPEEAPAQVTPRPSLVAAEGLDVPAELSTPATVRHEICGGGHLPVPPVPERPRLNTEEAREAIERAWREGLSVRQAARVSTRGASQVQRVYARLDAARGPQPVPGQLALTAEGVAA